MLKKTILLFSFTLLVINVFSQLTNNNFKITFSISPFISNYNIDFEEYQSINGVQYTSNTNYGAQLRLDNKFSNILALQIGIKYYQILFESEFPYYGSSIGVELPTYIERSTNYQIFAIPLNIKLYFLNTPNIGAFFKYGGSINAILDVKNNSKGTFENGDITEYKSNITDDYDQFSFSMNGGFGLEFKITNKLFIGSEIDYQYLNLKEIDKFNLRINNISLDFSVGIYI